MAVSTRSEQSRMRSKTWLVLIAVLVATLALLTGAYKSTHTDASFQENGEKKGDSILSWVQPGDKSGEFKRQQSQFRNWISREAGAEFPPEKDRYHLYVSYACPWGELSSLF